MNTRETANLCGLKREDFQTTVNGKQTDLYILKNSQGNEVAITNYGGALVAIMVPDRDGNYANVIQGHDTIEGVINSPEPYLSTLIGRYGNRICRGKFQLNGKKYELAINNGPNALHGGLKGWNAKVWEALQMNDKTLVLKYVSPYGEEGYTGEMKVTVVYTFTDENELVIEYMAQTNLLYFSADRAADYAEYLVNGKGSDPSVSVKDITSFFENNDSVAADTFGRALGNTEYGLIRKQLENNNVEEALSVEEWSSKSGFNMKSMSYLFSFITLGIFAALIVVLLIWIAVIVDRRGRHLASFYGNIFLWSGLIVFLAGFAVLGGAAIASTLTGHLVYYISAQVFQPFALFAMATGAFEFVVGFILKKVKKAIRRKERREKYAAKEVEKALAERELN